MTDSPRTVDAATLSHLQGWQGRTETVSDEITAAPLRGLSATLDRDDPPVARGTEVPPLWHWLYFLPQHRQSEISADGHAARGGFLPPVPLPRRMWAGGELQWHAPMRVGDAVQRQSTIESVTHKSGRTGDLVFVVVRHEIHAPQGLALTERHNIVYRAAAQPGEPVPAPTAAERDAPWQRRLQPDVTGVEGYPGLVVHGPLIATLLMDLLRREMPQAQVRTLNFRAVRPTFDIHPMQVNGRPSADGRSVSLWAQDHEGWLTMQAQVTLA
ncbi:MAG: acyl-CoA dehydrogenase [Betaproteobacteria bacterium]|nr:acyl-CoA dehydrogenase [Betaproteobacteria bacterium]